MPSHWQFGHLKPKLWAKEGPGIKLVVWLPTTKVGNRPLPDVRFECATWRWKDLDEGYNFGSDLVAIQLCSRELWRFKVPGVPPGQFRDNLCHLNVAPTGRRRVYYREYGGGILPSPGRGVSCGPKCPWLVPTPNGVPECELTTWVVCFDAESSLIY